MLACFQVKNEGDDFGWGVVVNFSKKSNVKVNFALEELWGVSNFMSSHFSFLSPSDCYLLQLNNNNNNNRLNFKSSHSFNKLISSYFIL